MTVTVMGAPAPRWRTQGRQIVLVIGGVLDTRSLPTVLGALRAAITDGADGVTLDVAAVQRCDREGLLGLVRVRGRDTVRRSCIVDVVGVRWVQFVAALADDPVREVETTRAMIRELRRPYMVDTTLHSVPAGPGAQDPRAMAESAARSPAPDRGADTVGAAGSPG